MERGRGVQPQVQRVALGERNGRDVLVLCRMQIAHDAHQIHDGTHIGRVQAGPSDGRVAGSLDKVGVWPIGKRTHDVLPMAVVEQSLRARLGEAGELQVDGTFEAICVGLQGQGAGQQVRAPLKLRGVGRRHPADIGEVAFDAGLLKTRFAKILRGANKDTGTSTYG